MSERRTSKRDSAQAASRKKTIDFGFDPKISPHHFAVVVKPQSVSIFERFELVNDEDPGADRESQEALKATLTRYLWDRIKEPAAAEFNRRLQADGLQKGAFTSGQTLLAPHFGKELTLLAWAVEDSDNDPTLVPTMTANWNGLAPEERWWFFTTISAATRGSDAPPRNTGWRRAIKIAFAENPVNLPPAALLLGPMPDHSRARRAPRESKIDDPGAGQLGLWHEGDRR